jgi:hypothetical protein
VVRLQYSDNEKLVNAIDRNTAATRAVAIFLIGSMPWILGGLATVAFSFMLFSVSPDESYPLSPLLLVTGSGVVVYGAIRTLIRALRELKFSEFT